MNLYKLTQTVNNGYDTYDSCIVAAPDEETARLVRPDSYTWEDADLNYSWIKDPKDVTVQLIGTTNVLTQGVVLASFNAG